MDAALEPLGLEREIGVVVGGFASALALVRSTDLVASVPDRHTGSLRAGMRVFALPFAAPEVTLSMLWHPRLDADPAHRWLRRCMREVCAEAGGSRARSPPCVTALAGSPGRRSSPSDCRPLSAAPLACGAGSRP